MREYKYHINYIKGTKNVVADTLSRPILLTEANNEGTWLGKSREEMRNLQREEERWKVLIDYIEGGKVPNKSYKRVTLDQFTLREGILHDSVTKKDGSFHFTLVVPLYITPTPNQDT